MKKFFYILVAIVIFGGGIWMLYDQFCVRESPDYARVARVLFVFGIYIAAYIRYFATRKSEVREVNEDAYGSIIGDAFHNEGEEYDRLMKGIELYNEDEYRKALRILEELLIQAKSLQEVFAVKFFMALCYSEQEEFEKEIEIYEDLLKNINMNQLRDGEENQTLLYNNLGNAYNNAGQYEKAKEILEAIEE